MSKEGRSIAIAGLVLFLFAFMGFLKDGSIIFPFPLNEFVFLAVATRFTFWHYKKGILPYLFLVSAVTSVIGTVFFWEIFLTQPELEQFLGYTFVDWSRLTSLAFLFVAGLYFIAGYRNWLYKFLFTAGLLIQIFGIAINNLNFEVLGLAILVLVSAIKPVKQPFHLLWVLLFLLEGSKLLTIALNLK